MPTKQCRDVNDLLDEIRLRPHAWLRQGSVRHLQSMMLGYHMALSVDQIDEPFAFSPVGPFAEWLRERNSWSMNCAWAAAIERHAGGEAPVDVFFRLLDEFRSRD
jgi:hypothetical protein